MRYAYFPGCSSLSTARPYDMSAREISHSLGIDLVEIPDWICCGASSAHATSDLLSLALPATSLAKAGKMGLDVVTACAACFSRLKIANKLINSDPNSKRDVNQIIQDNYQGDVKVKHLLDVLVNEYGLKVLREEVKIKLEGLRVACYYGCLLTRPPKIMGFDDPEDPKSMDELVEALGAEPVSWPYKMECCGASFSISKPEIVIRLAHDILKMAKDEGAECIAVACPLCQSNLDLYQKDIKRRYGTDPNLPVFYFTQLVGLSLGISPKRLGLRKHMVSPLPLLKTKGLV